MGTLFLLPESRLLKSPSAQDNLSAEDEYDIRILGCELIQSSGLILNLPQTAMATAQVLFHRFYYSKSFVRYPMQHTAMACVVLASKIEESPRRIRDIVKAFHKLSFIRKNLEPPEFVVNEKYVKMKNEVVKAERRILKELGFCVYVNHPHKFIVILLQILENVNDQTFMQTSWSYMNDGLRTDVFLRYSSETIACSCVYLSARVLGIPLPESPAWWEVFQVSEEDIRNVCKIILKLYTRPKPDQERLEGVIDKLRKECERTRTNIIKQFTKSTNETERPANNHVKKVKVEHIIQAPDGKRQISSSIELKEIKDESRRKRSQERNHSRSPRRRKHSSKDYQNYGNRDYSSKDYDDSNSRYDSKSNSNYDKKYDSKYGTNYDSKYNSKYTSKYERTGSSKYDSNFDQKFDCDDYKKPKESLREREYHKSKYRH